MNTTKPIATDHDATARALLALGEDVRQLTETAERIRVQYEALAKRHGIAPPAA
jgi:hypothetical protein